MKIEGEKFKLFIGDEEVDLKDCTINLSEPSEKDMNNAINHQLETSGFKESHSWSFQCDCDTGSIKDFYRALMMKEIKELTDNYNRVMRIKNK